MTAIVWDASGQRTFENGVDHGVLYPLNVTNGLYDSGVAWNGLTTIKETPAGAASNKQYADNIAYLNLLSAETFGATVEAFTYPPEFEPCDGTATPQAGVTIGQQPRQTFGLCYRSQIGNDIESNLGYKLHLVYGLLASPSERDYGTINDSPAAVAFSWDATSTPVNVSGYAPTSIVTINSTNVDPTALASLQQVLYGSVGVAPSLPLPDAVEAFFSGTITVTALPTVPSMTSDVITIPTVTGLDYRIGGLIVTGTKTITVNTVVTVTPKTGYILPAVCVDEWLYIHT